MISPALRVAGAALLLVFGFWAGAWVYRSAPNPSDLAPMPGGAIAGGAIAGGATAAGAAAKGSAADAAAADAAAADGISEGVQPSGKIPDRLPQFSLGDRTGKATPIASFAGKSLIINFWATWCAPCRSEIPLLQALHSEWADRDVSVVGIAVDYRDKVLDYANRLKIAYPLLIGEQDALDVAAALGVDSPVFPFSVFTDRRGEVVVLFIGELHRPQAEVILGEVQNLDKGLIELPAARQAITERLRLLKGLAARQPG